jgi:hypothetical protein
MGGMGDWGFIIEWNCSQAKEIMCHFEISNNLL